MKANSRITTSVFLLLSAAVLSATGAQQTETAYDFATGRYIIEMRVVFPKPYAGRRLVFYSSVNPQKPLCYSGDETMGKCMERFVGAVTLVQYSVRREDNKPLDRVAIREHVTVLAQSKGLPDRLPFSKTLALVRGIGSDLQVFGYDESEVKRSERMETRGQASQTMWRLYRQELYIDREEHPFAVLSGNILSIASEFFAYMLHPARGE